MGNSPKEQDFPEKYYYFREIKFDHRRESESFWEPFDISLNSLFDEGYENYRNGNKEKLIINDHIYDFKKCLEIDIYDKNKQRKIKRDYPSNVSNVYRRGRFE